MSEDAIKEEAPEHSEVELQAIEEGWNPDEEKVKAAGKEFVSAEEYLKRGSFFKKINEQNKVISELKSTIDQVNEHNRKVAEKERKNLIKEYEARIAKLEEDKIVALEEGDHRRVVQIDKELREKPPEVKPENPELDREFAKFKKDNAWYETDSEMRKQADIYGMGYFQTNPEASPKEVFDFVAGEIKARYKDKFENPNREKESAVDTGSRKKGSNGKLTVNELTSDEKTVFKNFERMGVFKDDASVQKYLKEVIELRS